MRPCGMARRTPGSRGRRSSSRSDRLSPSLIGTGRPFSADMANRTREAGHRVIAIGTTVVRALESAWTPDGVRPREGFTRLFVHPGNPVHSVDGLLTGFHDPVTSHLAMLAALIGLPRVMEAYREAIANGYRWHEFGDSHLILRK